MKTIYSYDSLNKHNITKEEVDQVYAMGKGFDLNPSLKGNDRVIWQLEQNDPLKHKNDLNKDGLPPESV